MNNLIWSNTVRTLATGTPDAPVTRDDLIAKTFWEYSVRVLTDAEYVINIVPKPIFGGVAFGELSFGSEIQEVIAPTSLLAATTGPTSIMLTWIYNSNN